MLGQFFQDPNRYHNRNHGDYSSTGILPYPTQLSDLRQVRLANSAGSLCGSANRHGSCSRFAKGVWSRSRRYRVAGRFGSLYVAHVACRVSIRFRRATQSLERICRQRAKLSMGVQHPGSASQGGCAQLQCRMQSQERSISCPLLYGSGCAVRNKGMDRL